MNQTGIYFKYAVSKTDGSAMDPKAKYFLLRYDAESDDKLALQTLLQYAKDSGNAELLSDLQREVAVASLMPKKRTSWADACTENCVWLFQVFRAGCASRTGREVGWTTEAVFLLRTEARRYGESRPYAWGKEDEGWRIYGVPARGCMVPKLLEAGVSNEFIESQFKEEKGL